MNEAPESVKYHGGYDPSDPPQGEHYCSVCSRWDDECECDLEMPIARIYLREAIELQLKKAREDGAQSIYFGALAIHPEANETCTFGELIDMIDAPSSQ